jgi:two-component system chemotaxis sensor kinase CheA
MTDLAAEMLPIFRIETNERLDRIEATLLAVEAGNGDGDSIDSLFRDAHSIKGNAGMVGFDEAQRVARGMEDVLEIARESGVLESTLADSLLEAADSIRRAVRDEPAAVIAEPVNGTPEPSAPRSMRVPAEKVDRLVDVVGETVLHRRRLDRLVDEVASHDQALEDELGGGDLLLEDLQDAVIRMRTQPLESITARYPRAVRDLAAAEGKSVRLEFEGTETQLDRVILDGISETIVHLLRNAIFHGVESPEERTAAGKEPEARIVLRAEPRGELVAVSVSDDGRGVAPELLEQAGERGSLAEVLGEPGVSTAAHGSDLAGRGVGLDAVKRHVESLGGSFEAESQTGRGSRMILHLPLTLALVHLLLLERGGQVFGVALASIAEVLSVSSEHSLGGHRSLEVRGASVPLVDLADVLGATAPPAGPRTPTLLVTSSGRQAAVICDSVLGEQQSVVKPLGTLLEGTSGYLGAAILADGRIALVLDPAFLCHTPGRERVAGSVLPAETTAPLGPKVLVVDDELTVRELQRSILEAGGYRVSTAKHGREALEMLSTETDVALLVTDIDMPTMDGLELISAIRGDHQHGSLPIVIISSRGDEEQRRRGAAVGADAYIAKTEFDQEALLQTVGRLVQLP